MHQEEGRAPRPDEDGGVVEELYIQTKMAEYAEAGAARRGHAPCPAPALGASRGTALEGDCRRGRRSPPTQIFGQLSTLSLSAKARRKFSCFKICAGGPDFDFEPFRQSPAQIFKGESVRWAARSAAQCTVSPLKICAGPCPAGSKSKSAAPAQILSCENWRRALPEGLKVASWPKI